MKHVFLLLFILTTFTASAQHSSCDGVRYSDDVFTDITHTEAVKYGENSTISGTFQELFLDVYEPTGDTEEKRPTIVLAFGGSFIAGERQALAFLCESYARKGYVAVTIDYRLYDGLLFPLPSQETMQNVVVRSIGDMKAAIRFLKEDADTENRFKIDPEYILVGGVSAGAITAAHAAMMDESDPIPSALQTMIDENGGIEGNSSENFQYSSDVIGLVSFSGALNNASLIDANDPPVFSVHDDGDNVVPYGDGWATISGFPIAPLEGSQSIHHFADSLGITNELITIENSGGHISYFTEASTADSIINRSAQFMQDVVCSSITINTKDISLVETNIFPNPASDRLSIETRASIGDIEIYNMMGQLIDKWTNEATVNIADIKSGQYILQVKNDGNDLIAVKKILIL